MLDANTQIRCYSELPCDVHKEILSRVPDDIKIFICAEVCRLWMQVIRENSDHFIYRRNLRKKYEHKLFPHTLVYECGIARLYLIPMQTMGNSHYDYLSWLYSLQRMTEFFENNKIHPISRGLLHDSYFINAVMHKIRLHPIKIEQQALSLFRYRTQAQKKSRITTWRMHKVCFNNSGCEKVVELEFNSNSQIPLELIHLISLINQNSHYEIEGNRVSLTKLGRLPKGFNTFRFIRKYSLRTSKIALKYIQGDTSIDRNAFLLEQKEQLEAVASALDKAILSS